MGQVKFNFDNHILDTDRRELRRGADLVAMQPQVFDLLVHLLKHRDRVVSRDDLIALVWGGRIVSDSTLDSRINAARNAVGDNGKEQRLIRTIPRKGIRFVGAVNGSCDAPAASPAEADQSRPGLSLPDRPAIAVLPFDNMSGDREQEYFSDGISEDITTALSKLRWFFVIARNSSFTYKGRVIEIRQIARELGVRYVLEGSVRKGGNRLRVTAQLIEAETGNHLWAERYDRDLADIFAVQDEITERVVAAIEPELYAAEQVRSQSKPPESLDAWECVIRALSLIGQGTRDENTEAEALCRRAIAIAPGYGRAHSLLAWTLLRSTFWSGDLRPVVPEVSAETQTALALDDRDPWAHFAQGMLQLRLRHPGEAARS